MNNLWMYVQDGRVTGFCSENLGSGWRLVPPQVPPIQNNYLEQGDGSFAAPPPSRIITGAAFLELLLPAEYALIVSTPAGAMTVARLAADGSQVNLDSPRIVTLFNQAVTANYITRLRADRILAGLPPL